MANRFYLAGDLAKPELQLSGSEAHHVIHVMRSQVGDRVTVFNGCGEFVESTIVGMTKRDVRLVPGEVCVEERNLESELTVAAAAPKGDRLRWMVEKLTELGVTRFTPVLTERTVVEPGQTKIEKLRQTVIAACKQSGRNWLMEISDPVRFDEIWEVGSGSRENARIVLFHPDGGSLNTDELKPWATVLVIGPEGGFSDDELQFARERGSVIARMGRAVLRTETAAIAAAAIVKQAGEC